MQIAAKIPIQEDHMPLDDGILGQGVYTPREAARLVGTNAQQVLRWTRGSGPHAAFLNAHYKGLDENVTEISFLDLIEVRVVAAMRRAGISLQSIRFAISYAQERLGVERPLISRAFKSDGSEILMDAVENDGELVSLSRSRPGQKVFREIVSQSLNDLEYEGDHVARWRPQGFSAVIIDPQRHFGDPILDEFGVSTKTLAKEFHAYLDLKYLAQIYEIPVAKIRMALGFEQSLDMGDG